ncbi:MAG: hypothetical protein BZ138_07905 [Methanosphaera sp. rholeuAM270]|nr:MAG: hypothetical protein BZ138_07905 [Methanosphaera sp. rholeuAM270]
MATNSGELEGSPQEYEYDEEDYDEDEETKVTIADGIGGSVVGVGVSTVSQQESVDDEIAEATGQSKSSNSLRNENGLTAPEQSLVEQFKGSFWDTDFFNGNMGQKEITEEAIGGKAEQIKFVEDFIKRHGYTPELFDKESWNDDSTEEWLGEATILFGNDIQKEFQKEYWNAYDNA